jgi:hypothetical protein
MRKNLLCFLLFLPLTALFSQDFGEDSTSTIGSIKNPENIPIVNLSESELEDNSTSQNVSSILTSARDPFLSAASFYLSSGGYRYRGYGGEQSAILINGLSMNDPESGFVLWSEWGGLNDMFRSRQSSIGLANSTFTFGGLGGGIMFDSRAGHLFKGLNASYAVTNQRYRNRLAASYVSGFMKGNWAVAAAFARRWAEKGYEPGTYFDGYSYFFSVEKLFTERHSLSLVAFGAPTRSARAAVSTREMQELADDKYYNPAWGFQNGQIRNANENNNFIPVFQMIYEGKFSTKTNLILSAMYQFGKLRYSSLDWYNAVNPAPDFYKNLPSLIEDSTAMADAQEVLRNNETLRQIRWDDIYAINANSFDSVPNANGAGQTLYGNWSRYVLSDRVVDKNAAQFSAIFNHSLDDHISYTGGLTYQFEKNRYYRQLKDLLGGDFFVNVNMFAERDFPDNDNAAQFDLQNPNQILKVGDKYGYDYFMTVHKTQAWSQLNFKYNRFDFFLSGLFSNTNFWRTGMMQNGLFPENSFGASQKNNFFNFGVKGGGAVKIDGRNYLFANAIYQTQAPNFNDTYLAPMLRNDVIPTLKNEKIWSVEAGYILRAPKVSARANFFFTEFRDGIQNYTYFHDDYRSMVNYSISGVGKRHFGAELGIDGEIYKGFGANAVANIARYTYTTRSTAYVTRNNDSKVLDDQQTVYWQGFNMGRTPQLALSAGLRYRSPKFWNVGINFNYFDWMWVEINPARRTTGAVSGLESGNDQWNRIVNQERLKGQFTMDIRGGYSMFLNRVFKFKAKQRFFLIFNATISNITNNTNFIISANEQLRFDYFDKNPQKFDTRYRYARGIGYFISINFRMQ